MSITEHTTKTARHTTFYLAAAPAGSRHLHARLAGARRELAAPAPRACCARLSDRRARHAWLRALERVPRHEDYAQEDIVGDMIELLDSLGQRKGGLGWPRLGKPGRMERREPPSGAHRSRREPLRALLHDRSRSRAHAHAGRSPALPRRRVPVRTVGLHALLRRELRRGDRADGRRRREVLEDRVSQGGPARRGSARDHVDCPPQSRNARRPDTRSAARRRRDHGGGPERLRVGARAQRVLRPVVLVHEPRRATPHTAGRRRTMELSTCRRCFSTPATTTSASARTHGWPSRCAPIAGT